MVIFDGSRLPGSDQGGYTLYGHKRTGDAVRTVQPVHEGGSVRPDHKLADLQRTGARGQIRFRGEKER
jgi:hypothetical protein